MNGLIVITARKCGEKVQPHVKVGNVYTVKESGKTKNGETALLCTDSTGKEYRINAARFDWQETTKEQIKMAQDVVYKSFKKQLQAEQEKEFKRGCRESFNNLRNLFTTEEHMQIAYVPTVLAQVAWTYAHRCREWCVEHKIQEVKKVGRGIIAINTEYEKRLRLDLSQAAIDHIHEQAESFLSDERMGKNMLLAEFTINNAFYREYPDVELLQLRTLATLGIIAVRAYERHVEKVNRVLSNRLGISGDRSVADPIITDKLYACFDAYRGEYELNLQTDEIKRIEKIFDIAIKENKLAV